ncbi:hypothetical protein U9M48_002127 [Paspalum notatum var. saurae]|uniref:F-box domain-containing protein n=1 Tax=Paspalum notatum var. saurae TaxID=547442 RepID=A0AAQ3PHB1_PASNO
MSPSPATLMEEIVEEILIRLPPQNPACLARASFVCKRWCRLISFPRFRHRFREFHHTLPMLGFLCNVTVDGGDLTARFVPTAASCAQLAERPRRIVLDARHGRVLLFAGSRSHVHNPPESMGALAV